MRQREILWFWLPLFASWLLMSSEGPIIAAAINRLPNEVIMLAAMGIVTSLSVTIESPIINLLATSTALVRDYDSFRLVRRFTIHWCILLTALAILIAYTPLFDVVLYGWLNVPAEVAEWVRPGMRIMILWSAAIGWRRFLQGIMIRHKQTRKVAYGTMVRLLASGGAVALLALSSDFPGVVIGSLALMAGVTAEAAYATLAVRPILREHFTPDAPPAEGAPLTYRDLFWFHLPLAATSLLILLVQPLVTSSLARLERPTESLAAWPVLFQILLMARAAAFALPEVIIALHQDTRTFSPLRRFSLNLMVAVTLAMAVFTFTPLAQWYVFQLQDMIAEVGELALSTLALFTFFPALAVLTSWLRGLLIQSRHTRYVNVAMAINLVITAAVLAWGVFRQWPGLSTAALALNLASLGEVLFLIERTRHTLPVELKLFRSPGAQPTQP
jgi:Na+-driven multidrug efflux pump